MNGIPRRQTPTNQAQQGMPPQYLHLPQFNRQQHEQYQYQPNPPDWQNQVIHGQMLDGNALGCDGKFHVYWLSACFPQPISVLMQRKNGLHVSLFGTFRSNTCFKARIIHSISLSQSSLHSHNLHFVQTKTPFHSIITRQFHKTKEDQVSSALTMRRPECC